ncbi:MAG: alcohol dehydrogenase catalytic domain-containing protein [Clostridia bacterium]|nr:alcohol dehydrogenase catalytic domain-containing protein [Clostridia bacterium]
MKGWVKSENGILTLIDLPEEQDSTLKDGVFSVKMLKSLITTDDLLELKDDFNRDNYVLGTAGIGIVTTDADENSVFSLKKGDKVYVKPFKACGECIYCKSNVKNKCADLKVAGEDYDGFLKEFVDCTENEVVLLPESITDNDALFIQTISLALNIIDRLNVQKGEHVVILGANNLGIITAQLLKYYQSIPIIIDNSPERISLAKECGIYYALCKDKDWVSEVNEITSGRMASQTVYLQSSGISIKYAFMLSAVGATIAIAQSSPKATLLSLYPATKKELNFVFINTGYGNTSTAINIIVNKAIDLSKLALKTINFNDCGELINSLAEKFNENDFISDIAVDMI